MSLHKCNAYCCFTTHVLVDAGYYVFWADILEVVLHEFSLHSFVACSTGNDYLLAILRKVYLVVSFINPKVVPQSPSFCIAFGNFDKLVSPLGTPIYVLLAASI